MRKFTTVCGVVSAILLPAVAQAKEPLELAPSSHWNLSYDEEACRLARTFGQGDEEVALILTKYAPGTGLELMASGKLLAHDQSRRFVYSFNPQEEREVERPLFGELEDGGAIWQFSSGLIPPDETERLGKSEANRASWHASEASAAGEISSFSILRGVEQPVRLRTGSLAPVMAAIDTCLADLVKSWGFDPDEQSNLAQGPEPTVSPIKWINSRDYPDGALRKELAGAVRFRLGIDAAGRVTDCTIQSSYSDPDFPATVCKIFTREGRFRPARTAAGEPVASFYSNTVLFTPG